MFKGSKHQLVIWEISWLSLPKSRLLYEIVATSWYMVSELIRISLWIGYRKIGLEIDLLRSHSHFVLPSGQNRKKKTVWRSAFLLILRKLHDTELISTRQNGPVHLAELIWTHPKTNPFLKILITNFMFLRNYFLKFTQINSVLSSFEKTFSALITGTQD